MSKTYVKGKIVNPNLGLYFFGKEDSFQGLLNPDGVDYNIFFFTSQEFAQNQEVCFKVAKLSSVDGELLIAFDLDTDFVDKDFVSISDYKNDPSIKLSSFKDISHKTGHFGDPPPGSVNGLLERSERKQYVALNIVDENDPKHILYEGVEFPIFYPNQARRNDHHNIWKGKKIWFEPRIFMDNGVKKIRAFNICFENPHPHPHPHPHDDGQDHISD